MLIIENEALYQLIAHKITSSTTNTFYAQRWIEIPNLFFFVSNIDGPSISYKKESYIFELTVETGSQAMDMEPPKNGMQNGSYQEYKNNDCFPTIEGWKHDTS